MTEENKNKTDSFDNQNHLPGKRKNFSERTAGSKAFRSKGEENAAGFSWSAVANRQADEHIDRIDTFLSNKIEFGGKNLENGKFANENFENASFSVAKLKGVDFSGANLKGVDFSGADLTDANLSGADLTGAVLSGAVLKNTNFTGAKLNGVVLTDADLENAILLDIEIDQIGLEDLQELIEYLAKYAPHKLNLNRLNLTLLDLSKIDLKNCNLRGVDFTGCDFTGVNIMELDLSECIITPQQIAKALGRLPNAEELRRIMAPKTKAKGAKSQAIDISGLFLDDGREVGVWNTAKDPGISIKQILEVSKKVFRMAAGKPKNENPDAVKKLKEETSHTESSNEELRKVIEDKKRALIEERKRAELAARQEKRRELEQAMNQEKTKEQEKAPAMEKPRVKTNMVERMAAARDRSRD